MSVVPLTVNELGTFAALCTKHSDLVLDKAAVLCGHISVGNSAAYTATYNEPMEPVPAIEIAAVASKLLECDDLTGHWGPLAYNMIANNGRVFTDPDLFRIVETVENKIRKITDAEAIRLKRAEENAAAFNDMGQLLVHSIEDIRAACRTAGCHRIIVASFHVNESELQSDYHGGREARRVVIGFGKGKRENFKQLRAVAALFPPTAHLGPGRDAYGVGLVWDHNHADDPNRAFISVSAGCDRPYKGQSVPFIWYSDKYNAPHGRSAFSFDTRAAADAFVADNAPLRGTEWCVSCESYENRENYSMGGGNYLTAGGRYSGWKVLSYDMDFTGMKSVEWWKN